MGHPTVWPPLAGPSVHGSTASGGGGMFGGSSVGGGSVGGGPVGGGSVGGGPAASGSAASGQTFNWLLVNFVRNTDGVRDAVAVSSDGLLIAMSAGLDRAAADQLAAIVSGLVSLARSASRRHDFDGLKLIMIEMRLGFLLVSTIADGSCIGVLADVSCDVGLIGYEIALLVDRAGAILTPALIAESRMALTR